jgi:hypothetical protein
VSIRCDASTDRARVASAPSGSVTIMFWVRWSSFPTQYQAVFWSGDTTAGANAYDASFMIVNGNPADTIEVWLKNSTAPRMGPTANLAANTWYHVAATYGTANGAACELFLDGVSVDTGTAGSAAAFQTEETQFGNDANSDENPQARIMCGKMWNRILTVAEIRAEMWSALPVSADSLWGCWSMFDDSGGLHDLSGNGRHLVESGTLTVEANDCGAAFDTPRTFTGFNRTTAASGAITGTVALDLGVTGALTGAGALAGTVALSITPSGALTGAGALVGSVALSLTPTGALTGAGAIAGSITNALAVTGTLTGDGALAGSVGLALAVSGVFDAPPGDMSGAVNLAFDVGGALTGTGALTGSVPFAFDVSGTLANSTPPQGRTPAGGYDKFRKASRADEERDEDKRKLRAIIEAAIAGDKPVSVATRAVIAAEPEVVADVPAQKLAQLADKAEVSRMARARVAELERVIENARRQRIQKADDELIELLGASGLLN